MNYDIKLTKVLEEHADYLRNGDVSKRANLSGAWLNGARLPIYYYLPEDSNG